MEKKKYYVIYGDFANTYKVGWYVGDIDESTGWERITKAEADRLVRRERERRLYGENGGFASAEIGEIVVDNLGDYVIKG